ncbi:MAG: TetR/AcrR family transcriptional regulator [Spirochaetaceae bacterium]
MKSIQRARVKNYFIEAAIDIIKEDGLEKLTTKKIGDKAGYSYATIYNYFENYNELICICMIKLAEECTQYLSDRLTGENILERCLSFIEHMVEFNAKNTNIYYPFLSTKVDFTYFNKDNTDHFIHPAYNILLTEIQKSEELTHLTTKETEILADILTSTFNSALHFYIILKNPKDIQTLKSNLSNQLTFIISNIIK